MLVEIQRTNDPARDALLIVCAYPNRWVHMQAICRLACTGHRFNNFLRDVLKARLIQRFQIFFDDVEMFRRQIAQFNLTIYGSNAFTLLFPSLPINYFSKLWNLNILCPQRHIADLLAYLSLVGYGQVCGVIPHAINESYHGQVYILIRADCMFLLISYIL
jgi:hypothetical protein